MNTQNLYKVRYTEPRKNIENIKERNIKKFKRIRERMEKKQRRNGKEIEQIIYKYTQLKYNKNFDKFEELFVFKDVFRDIKI